MYRELRLKVEKYILASLHKTFRKGVVLSMRKVYSCMYNTCYTLRYFIQNASKH